MASGQDKKKRKPKGGPGDKTSEFAPEDFTNKVPDTSATVDKLDAMIKKAKVKERELKAAKQQRRSGCCMD